MRSHPSPRSGSTPTIQPLPKAPRHMSRFRKIRPQVHTSPRTLLITPDDDALPSREKCDPSAPNSGIARLDQSFGWVQCPGFSRGHRGTDSAGAMPFVAHQGRCAQKSPRFVSLHHEGRNPIGHNLGQGHDSSTGCGQGWTCHHCHGP